MVKIHVDLISSIQVLDRVKKRSESETEREMKVNPDTPQVSRPRWDSFAGNKEGTRISADLAYICPTRTTYGLTLL